MVSTPLNTTSDGKSTAEIMSNLALEKLFSTEQKHQYEEGKKIY